MFIKQTKSFINFLSHINKTRNQIFRTPSFSINNLNNHRSINALLGYNSKKFFATKKQVKVSKKPVEYKQNQQAPEQTQFLWKFTTVSNLLAIATSIYFPSQSFIFIFILNSLTQMYESSRSINSIKQITDKMIKQIDESNKDYPSQIKNQMKKVLFNLGPFLLSTILYGTDILYPGMKDYAMFTLNFWILWNIKRNNFSHGYYFVLLSLLIFQFFYFKKNFLNISNNQEQKAQ